MSTRTTRSTAEVGWRSAVALTLALLGACSLPASDGAPTGPAGSTTPSSGADGPDTPATAAPPDATVPPQLRECGGEGPTPALETLTWSVPDGFEEAGGLTQVAPLEPDYTATYLRPERPGTGVEVLVLVHYPHVPTPLTDGCGDADRKRVQAYLTQWHDEAGITASDQQWTEVAGLPAISERQQYAGYDFAVDSHILVGSGELMMISCQWTGQQDVIGAGCEELLASVRPG